MDDVHHARAVECTGGVIVTPPGNLPATRLHRIRCEALKERVSGIGVAGFSSEATRHALLYRHMAVSLRAGPDPVEILNYARPSRFPSLMQFSGLRQRQSNLAALRVVDHLLYAEAAWETEVCDLRGLSGLLDFGIFSLRAFDRFGGGDA